MSPRLLTLAAGLLCAAPLFAETEAPAATAPPYQLQRKSIFKATGENQRAPFWPIGWVKRKAGAATLAQPLVPKVTLDEKAFRVTSIMLGNPSFAIINGRNYGEGEFIRQPRSTGAVPTVPTIATAPGLPANLRIRVYRIDDGAVTLQNDDQLLTIKLQRPELVSKTGEEALLLEDRP